MSGLTRSLLNSDFSNETAGGLGFAMRETDDGKIIANFILTGGPAEKAGMKWGAEIISLDGQAHRGCGELPRCRGHRRSATRSIKRLQQLRYALRFKLDKGKVEVKFQEPRRQSSRPPRWRW